MATIIILAVLFLLMGAGVPLAYTIGAASVLIFFVIGDARYLAVVPQRMFSQMDVFAVMAIPLFVWAGELMNRGGITKALVDFGLLVAGRVRGGLGHAAVITSVFFSGISGSAAADIAAISSTFVSQMRQRGYDPLYAGALTAAASVIGPIIPPSIIMILYGAVLSTDVAALFVAGIVPGLLIAGALMGLNAWMAHQEGHPGGTPDDVPAWRPTVAKALPALSLPAIILGGIVFGVMTPIEAGAIAVVAAVGLGFWYRELDLESFLDSTRKAIVLTGVLFIFLAAGALGTYLIALSQLADQLAAFLNSFGLTGFSYLIALMVAFLVLGMFVDIVVSLTLFAPLVVPIAIAQGMDPVALGVLVCVNLTLGLVTPPLGGAIMLVATITQQDYWSLCKRIIPFVIVEILILALIVLFPEIALALPRWLGML